MVNALFMDGWTVTGFEETETSLTIDASYDLMPNACPKCGVVGAKFHKHGTVSVKYVQAPTIGLPCKIQVSVLRLKCLECGKTFTQPLAGMAESYQMTERCLQYIEREAKTETWAKIGRRVGIDEKTVRTIARDAAARRNERRKLWAPLVLGIDELRLDGDLRAIFTDGAHRWVLDILPGNSKRQVYGWLSRLPHRERTRVVTMDMYGPYRDVVEHLFPQAAVVVDRWHVQKRLNEALDAVRVRVSRAQRTKKLKMAVLRKRTLLQISRHRLRRETVVMLTAWLENVSPVLLDAWNAKEMFYEVWDAKSREDAESAFDRAKALVPVSVDAEFGMAGFCGVVERWRRYIFPYFDPDKRYTNAYAEAANGLIKQFNRAGRGYEFEQIRAKALAHERLTGPRMFVCEECLKRFEAEPGMWFFFGMSVCPDCVESHAKLMAAEKHQSTPTFG